MKTRLEIKQNLKLWLTPKMQQAIQLLLLPREELLNAVQIELDRNPLLEYDLTPVSETEYSRHSEEDSSDHANITAADRIQNKGEFLPEFSSRYTEETTISRHLLWQMQLAHFTPIEQQIALTIIDAIDDSGYLQSSLSEIQESLAIQGFYDIEISLIQAILQRIQQFDPPGIAARNLSECLGIQLDFYPSQTPYLEQTKTLVLNYLQLLANREYTALKSVLKLNTQGLIQVLKLISEQNPKPGSRLSAKGSDYVIPDVWVRHQNNRWVVDLNSASIPRLRVNMDYAMLIKHGNFGSNTEKLRGFLEDAQCFLKGLHTRHETLFKVSRAIVERQQDFFQYGEEALKPMALKEIAMSLNLHESTVSRVTHQKYMATRMGIYELKYFFSNSLAKEGSRGATSATAARALIKKLISKESTLAPLSDQQITEILAQQGIDLCRRTVAKYRVAMHIPTAHQRKKSQEREKSLDSFTLRVREDVIAKTKCEAIQQVQPDQRRNSRPNKSLDQK